ncbi:hypothetical protein LTR86_001826 [Recurvomyces mirabilis]|nr:hypothetical protein LTR86_001826 [Recurvomyces mirabilis]
MASLGASEVNKTILRAGQAIAGSRSIALLGAAGGAIEILHFLNTLHTVSPVWGELLKRVSPMTFITAIYKAFREKFTRWMHASVVISQAHPLYKHILTHMIEHGLAKDARDLSIDPPKGSGDQKDEREHYKSPAQLEKLAENEKKRGKVDMVPALQSKFAFTYAGYQMWFERNSVKAGDQMSTVIVITCRSFGAGPQPIQNFLQHVQEVATTEKPGERMTKIFIVHPSCAVWGDAVPRPARGLSAVTLDEHIKDSLVDDISTYLDPKTKTYYANRGIPYRRGYLFYGPGGTGKTSFATAIAGHFKLDVFMLSLSNPELTDVKLQRLFDDLPSKCIILLEDVDSSGIERGNMRKSQAEDWEEDKPKSMKKGVTLSGLLNVLDGINSGEGRITIMTSNSPDSLDPALVRPGRIDDKILFGYASRQVAMKLFTHIFKKSVEELANGEVAGTHDYAALAKEFADSVPASELTPAEIQGYLLRHRKDDIEKVVEGAAAFAATTIQTRETGANVVGFAGDGKTERTVTDVAVNTASGQIQSATIPSGGVGKIMWPAVEVTDESASVEDLMSTTDYYSEYDESTTSDSEADETPSPEEATRAGGPSPPYSFIDPLVAQAFTQM